MDIKTLTIEALKALAYDQVVILQNTQQNIAIIQQEIKSRAEQVPEKPVENNV